jgi:NADH-quinone oxidoreductase subunit M
MTTETLRVLLVVMLVIPLAAAVVAGLLGPRRRDAIRWVSLAATLASLVLALILAVNFADRQARAAGEPRPTTFQPEFVPGDPGETHGTTWNMLPIGGSAIQFYVGIDGLNVWLIVLTALLMVSAVLVSWTAVGERVNEYYGWLLALGTGMLGVFLSFDVILFYVFFELTLVPLFFLIGIWGGPQRQHAARKFFIFTLTGSLITLLGVLAVVLACHQLNPGRGLTFSIPALVESVHDLQHGGANSGVWLQVQRWIFLALIAGFAIKVPLVPLHTWLPLAHVEAPTAGSVLLAGVLLKIGSYGFLRLCLPLTPDASVTIGVPLICTLSVIGIIYGALCALAQDDIKKLVAYSSVSHLGFCMLGMFALNEVGITGSLLQMINHGLSTGALFLLVGMLYERYHTRKMADYGGLAARLRVMGFFWVFICLTSVGLPGLNGFVGEALVLMGSYRMQWLEWRSPVYAIVASSGILLGAWYLLALLRRVFFGPVKEPAHEGHGPTGDLNGRELAALLPIAAACVFLGVYPQPVIDAAARDIGLVSGIVGQAQKQVSARQAPAVAADRAAGLAPAVLPLAEAGDNDTVFGRAALRQLR